MLSDISIPDKSNTDHVQPLLDRNQVGVNSPVHGSPASLWNFIDSGCGDFQNQPTDIATNFPSLSESNRSTLTGPMQTISLIPETPTQSSATTLGDASYYHNEHAVLEHSQLDTAGIEDWLPSQFQNNERISDTWMQFFGDSSADPDNQNSLATALDHQHLLLEHTHLQTPVVLSYNSGDDEDDATAVSSSNHLQVPVSVGERESSPAGLRLIFGPSSSRAQTPVSILPGTDGFLTPIDYSVETLKYLSQVNQPLPSPGSKRSRQATTDSAETVTQGCCSNPASGNAVKPPRKRQKPRDSALTQTDPDPLATDNVECFALDDSEAISRAIRIVKNSKTIRDLVLSWDDFKARHYYDDDSAALDKYLSPDSHRTPEVDPSSGSHHDIRQSQQTLAVYAPTPSRSLQMFESQREEDIDVSYSTASIGMSERQIMKQRADDPVAARNEPEFSQTSWNVPTSTLLSYDHGMFASTCANTPSSAASHLNIDCSWSLAGTSCHPSPVNTHLTTPASSHAPLSAHIPTNSVLKSALNAPITTSQVGLVTKPQAVQYEMISDYETPSRASSSAHERAAVAPTNPQQRQRSTTSNSGMQYGQSILKFLPHIRRQTQPTPVPASISLDTTQAEPTFTVPNLDSTRDKIATCPMQPPNFILIPQEIKFYKNMETLCENLKKPICFRYEGATYDGVRLLDARSDIKTRNWGGKLRICDSNTKFSKDALPASFYLRINWPGYTMVQMQLQPNRRKKLGISNVPDRQRVLKCAVSQVIQMMEKLSQQEFNPEPNQECYRIGTPTDNKLERWLGGLSYHDIIIASITQKSRGVWQPELWLDTSNFGSSQQ